MNASRHLLNRELRTPRAAATAGLLFAGLYTTSYVIILRYLPEASSDRGAWTSDASHPVRLAIALLPFAGISFLWFMAVVRDRLGHLEDQFFSTLFFGSGLLYLTMTMLSAAIGSALLQTGQTSPGLPIDPESFRLARAIAHSIVTNYAIRMAGMFMIVLGTIWFRTRLMPRPFVVLTYVLALVLLTSITLSPWIIIVFPAWVALVSFYILYLNFRPPQAPGDDTTRSGR